MIKQPLFPTAYRTAVSRLSRFVRGGRYRQVLLIEAAFWLAIARLIVLTMPFQRFARFLGTFTSPHIGNTIGRQSDPLLENVRLAREVGWAVTRAARYVPFTVVCLPQAMAAKKMLNRRKVTAVLFFGAARDAQGKVESHAWLVAADVEVVGFPVASDFVPISCFI